MTHQELCRLTAAMCAKKFDVVLCDYQTMVSDEHPDVLAFNGQSTLYEIKVSRQDFLRDSEKECRKKYKMFYTYGNVSLKQNSIGNIVGVRAETYKNICEPFYREYPHLGRYRYYVCENGLISAEEVSDGWGLYWFKSGRFYKKKESKKFRNNLFLENILLVHAVKTLKNKKYNQDKIFAKE